MQKIPLWVGVGALAVVVGGAVALGTFAPSEGPTNTASNADGQAVRAVVVELGTKLKNVSLLAPDAPAQIAEQYAGLVAPETIGVWQADTTKALGRETSSPWPDSIDVVEVMPAADGIYTVEANIIEVANGQGSTEPVAVQPVTFTVVKQGDGYLITGATKGSYSELPQRQTITGTWECLPHKDTTGPQTMECAFGIAVGGQGHYAVDTSLMSVYPVDYPTGTVVRISGIVTPVEQLNSIQRYDIKGIIRATSIEKVD